MHRNDLRSLLHASPFRPFRLIMVDGKVFPVAHEDFVHITQDGTIIYEEPGDRPWKMLNAKLVARIEFLEEETAGR